MKPSDQVLLGKLLTAAAVLLVRTNPDVRRQVLVAILQEHEPEVVNAVITKAA